MNTINYVCEATGERSKIAVLKSCRITYNDSFDGNIYITNTDPSSKPIGLGATIRISFKEFVDVYYKDFKAPGSKRMTQVIKTSYAKNGLSSEITVLQQDIFDFVSYALRCKIESKLDSMSSQDIVKLATALEMGV